MENPFKNQVIKIKRTAKLTQILAKYGFRDLLARRSDGSREEEDYIDGSFYKRIRLAIEELGPTFVKFGQTLASREDLLPGELIIELRKLQDRVPPQDIDIIAYLQEQLGENFSKVFREVNKEPIASASIAQVYKAVLIDGRPVILKVRRPHIRKTIESDLLILKDIIYFLSDYSAAIRQINLTYILEAFQKTLIEELSFIHEARNIQQFAQNFKDHDKVHSMQLFDELSNDEMICVSWVEGFKVTDKEQAQLYNIKLEYIVELGVELFLTQVLEHGFFHADPHPGNVVVTPDGKMSFLDLGAMGRMLPSDQQLLEDFIVAFINKDADSLIYTIKKMAIHIEIENEKALKREILDIFDMVTSNTLEHIDIKTFFSKFSGVLNKNNILMPDHIYLLVRGVVIMEGIGRDLVPGLNLVKILEPYISRIVRKRLSFENLQEEVLRKLQESYYILITAPGMIKTIGQQLEQGELSFKVHNSDLKNLYRGYQKNQSINRYLAIGCVFFVGGCLLVSVDQLSFFGLSVISWIFFVIGISFLLIAKFRGFRVD